MPQDNDLYCPSCGRKLINFAEHPDQPDRTVAYCVCNNIGPVLEFSTSTPPTNYMNPPGTAGEKEIDA